VLFFRYLVFYSPFDVVYKVGKLLPFKMVICGLKEVQRASKVYGAVNHTAKLYPNAYIIIVLIGTIKGNPLGVTQIVLPLVLWFVHGIFSMSKLDH